MEVAPHKPSEAARFAARIFLSASDRNVRFWAIIKDTAAKLNL